MDDFQELVCARLQALPKDFTLSVGNYGDVTKDEALNHVKNNDEVGQFIISINREYFNALKTGGLYASLN